MAECQDCETPISGTHRLCSDCEDKLLKSLIDKDDAAYLIERFQDAMLEWSISARAYALVPSKLGGLRLKDAETKLHELAVEKWR